MNTKFLQFPIISIISLLVIVTPVLAYSSWPGPSTATDIGTELLATDPGFEPSGIVYHPGRNTYIVVSDEGQLAEVEPDGTLVDEWDLGRSYDLEDVTVADDASSIVYLAEENTSSAIAFDLDSGSLTGDSWSFSSYITEVSNLGLEGLAWVPDGDHSYGTTVSGGLFYAGWQEDADIYVFEPDLATSGSVTYHDELRTTSGMSDISGLAYDHMTGILYVVYDGYDLFEMREANGTLLGSYSLPGSGQEGIAVATNCPSTDSVTVVISEDDDSLESYASVPVTCTVRDDDGDGVDSETDCNDTDASVWTDQTYYTDADGDGYGADTSTTSCTSTPPSGYADNSDDLYDNARIELCSDGVDNDGDTSIDEANTLTENGPHPLYRTYSVSTTGHIASVGAVIPSNARVTYNDGSCYDYVVPFTGIAFRITAVSGTSSYTLSYGGIEATLNGLIGAITDVHSTVTVSPLKTYKIRTRF